MTTVKSASQSNHDDASEITDIFSPSPTHKGREFDPQHPHSNLLQLEFSISL